MPPLKVCQTFTVGVTPASMSITSCGTRGYVANSNDYELKGEDSVTVLDLQKGLPILTIHDDSFKEPYRIGIDEKYVYVCNSGSTTLTIIEIKSNKVVGVIEGFDGPAGIAISGGRAYVTNFGVTSMTGHTVSVVDLLERKITATIETDTAPQALTISNDRVYVVCYVDGKPGHGTLNVIDLTSNTVTAKLLGLFGPFGIVVSGYRAYVPNFGSNDFDPYGKTLAVIDLHKGKIIKEIELGIQPSGIAIRPDGKYVYVSNFNELYAKPGFQQITAGAGTVNIIRTKDLKVITPTISVGRTPSTLTMAPNGQMLYACQYIENTISAIRLRSGGKGCKERRHR